MFRQASNPMQLDGTTSSPIIITQASALAQKAIVINNTSGGAVPIAFEYQIGGTPVFTLTASALDTTLTVNVAKLGLESLAAPSTDSAGQCAFDNNAWAAGRGAIQVFDGTANTYIVAALASDTPSNGQVPTWNTGGTVTWETPSAGGSALPTWTFSAAGGDPTAGQLKTNNAAPASTTSITIAGTCAGGGIGFDALYGAFDPPGSFVWNLIFTNTTTGEQQRFSINSATDSGTFATLSVDASVTTATAWSGTYSVQYLYSASGGETFVRTVDGNAPDGSGNAVSDVPLLSAVLAASSITPIADGTVTPVTSITTDDGVVTAAS